MKKFLLLAIWATTAVTAFLQNDFTAFDNLGIGLKVSPTLGYGIETATGINNNLILRLGLTMTHGISFGQHNLNLGFEEDYIMPRFGYEPEYRAKPLLKFAHGNLLLDYHPGGIFCVTAGFFCLGDKIRSRRLFS